MITTVTASAAHYDVLRITVLEADRAPFYLAIVSGTPSPLTLVRMSPVLTDSSLKIILYRTIFDRFPFRPSPRSPSR